MGILPSGRGFGLSSPPSCISSKEKDTLWTCSTHTRQENWNTDLSHADMKPLLRRTAGGFICAELFCVCIHANCRITPWTAAQTLCRIMEQHQGCKLVLDASWSGRERFWIHLEMSKIEWNWVETAGQVPGWFVACAQQRHDKTVRDSCIETEEFWGISACIKLKVRMQVSELQLAGEESEVLKYSQQFSTSSLELQRLVLSLKFS